MAPESAAHVQENHSSDQLHHKDELHDVNVLLHVQNMAEEEVKGIEAVHEKKHTTVCKSDENHGSFLCAKLIQPLVSNECSQVVGFRDIKNFNIALLAKQLWHLLHHYSSLLARVLKGMSYRYMNPLEIKVNLIQSIRPSQYIKPDGLCWVHTTSGLDTSINRLLFECPPVLQTWALSYLPSALEKFMCTSVYDNFDFLLFWAPARGVSTQRLAKFSWIMWYLWKARSDKLFNGVEVSPLDSLHKATQECEDWFVAQEVTKLGKTREQSQSKSREEMNRSHRRRCQVYAT
ncbi:hypothetical protein N665_0092s0041 [Sinapis alba]|nr:hypothetical protein N665_0092s0041 [Sinapis alba]